MKNNHIETVAHLFSGQKLGKRKIAAIETTETLVEIRKQLRQDIKPAIWWLVYEQIQSRVGKLFDNRIDEILLRGWNKVKPFRDALEKSRRNPEATFVIPLATHVVKSDHKPAIQILVDERKAGELVFNVNIDLHLKGVVLKVEDGRIQHLVSGQCKASGQVMFEDIRLLKVESKEIPVPGKFNMD